MIKNKYVFLSMICIIFCFSLLETGYVRIDEENSFDRNSSKKNQNQQKSDQLAKEESHALIDSQEKDTHLQGETSENRTSDNQKNNSNNSFSMIQTSEFGIPDPVEIPKTAKKGFDGVTRWKSADGMTKTSYSQKKSGESIETSQTNNFDGPTTITTIRDNENVVRNKITVEKNVKTEKIIDVDGSYRVVTYDLTGRSIPKTKYYEKDDTVKTDDPNLTTIINAVRNVNPDGISDVKDPGKSVFNEDVNNQELQMSADILDSMRSKLEINKNEGKRTTAEKMSSTAAKESGKFLQADINDRYTALKNQDKDARSILQKKLNDLRSADKVGKMTDADKQNFSKDFVKQQLSLFGKDQNSGENLFQLPNDMQTELLQELKNKFDEITDSMNIIEQSNKLAQMSDMIMNKISEGKPKYTTEIDDQGNYTTTTESASKIKLSSTIDKDGNPVSRTFQVDDVQFVTDFKNGWFYGKSKNNIKVKIGDEDVATLSPESGEVLSALWMQHKANEALAMTAKLTGWTGKQVLINGVGMSVPIPPVLQAVIGVTFIPALKLVTMIPVEFTVNGYQLTGHSFSDPAAQTVVMQLIKGTVGDEGQIAGGLLTGDQPLMSGKADTVFRSNTVLTGDNANASIDNTYFNPIVDVLTTITNISSAPFKALFPKTLGDQMFSSSEISQAQSSRSSDAAVAQPKKLFS